MKINDLGISDGGEQYNNEAFRHVLEDHVVFLAKSPGASNVVIQKHIAYKYQFDLSGFLLHHNVPIKYHWIIMRCNGLTSLQDGIDRLDSLILPNFDQVEKIRQAYYTTNKIT